MARLAGRIAIVTGAGRGLGRAHALFLASEGAKVLINDLGADLFGQGVDKSPAQQVVEEILAAGGEAVASGHDVADWEQAQAMVRLAIDTFGGLHVLVNNAGILRDRALANMNEGEWDSVIRVHLKGHAAPTRHALAYWRDQAKAGARVQTSVIHTTSTTGLFGNYGQANYGAAKLGIVGLSRITAIEGEKYGVRSNAISPSARTRMLDSIPGMTERFPKPTGPDANDMFDPANMSPLVGWLAEAECPATSQIFHVIGNRVFVIAPPTIASEWVHDGNRWTPAALE
ncbi:MAG: SDR family NAD(P)-dependent oxidoreductase, partial [Gemmatimonadota bacterium]